MGRIRACCFTTDLFGIRPANQDVARRIAAAGYTVLMPNVFLSLRPTAAAGFRFQMGEERSMKRDRAVVRLAHIGEYGKRRA